MPDDEQREIHHSGQYEEPTYSEEELPETPVNVPKDVPQEHLSHTPLSSSPVERAPKSEIARRFIYMLIVLLIIAVVVFAGWKLLPGIKTDNKPAQTNQSSQNQEENSQANPEELALGSTALTKHYTSDILQLELKYPDSWQVSEKGNYILVKSPGFDMEDNSGVSGKTYFKVYIEMSTAGTSDSKYLGRGYALSASQKVSYSEPGPSQRKNTYLTDFGLDTPDNFAYFILQGGFKLIKGDTLGPNYASEPEAYLIAGGFGSDQQKDNLQTRVMPADSYKQDMAYKTGLEIAKSIKFD
ncbi:MAG TPA: hypothetical protein VFW77_01075 [Candidatus Saccharimonadales bacterium]|nr:hypothetical protein [Candidatus Saccharimonadales bacterium]